MPEDGSFVQQPTQRDSHGVETIPSSALLLVIVGVALALRLPGLNDSLWYDEMWSTRVILGSFSALVHVIGSDVHPPFYAVVMFAWIRLFGDSEISVRMLPLISSLLTIVLTARLAVAYGWPRAAPIAALVLAISPPHIWYAHEARPYSLLVLLVVASTLAFLQIRQTHATRWYVVYAVLALCMVMTHYFALAYVAAITLLAMTDRRLRARMLWIAVAVAFVLALYLAARFVVGSIPNQAGHLRGFGLVEAWQLMFDWFIIGGAFGPLPTRATAIRLLVPGVQLVFLALVVRGLLKSQTVHSDAVTGDSRWSALARRGELPLLLLILPLSLLAIGLVGAKRFYIERSALTALPFLAIAIGIGVASLRSLRWRASSIALIVGFGAVVLVHYYPRAEDKWTVYQPKVDWRSAAHWLSDESSRSKRPVVVVSMTPALSLLYYGPGFSIHELNDSLTGTPAASDRTPGSSLRQRIEQRFAIPVDPQRGRTGRVYFLPAADMNLVHAVLGREQVSELFVVSNRYLMGPMGDAVRADPSFEVETAFEGKGISLLRARRKGDEAAGLHSVDDSPETRQFAK